MENYNRYKIATEKADWRAICEINGVSFDALGTQKELAVLPNYLESGEIVFALVSGLMKQTVTSNAFDFGANTWLAVLTSERFLFLDAAMLTSSVDTQSIRLKNVQAISASQGFILGKIMIDLGSRIVVVDNCSKESVKVMAELGNRWIKELENGFVPPKENPDMADFKKKVNEDRVSPPVSDGPVISRTSAAIVTGLFGWFGLNDFIWGIWGAGAIKCGFLSFAHLLDKNDHFVAVAFIGLILVIWVFIDLARIYDGTYFKEKKVSPVSGGLIALFQLIYFAFAILAIYNCGSAFFDSRKKDTGKLASAREIVDTYNQNEAATDDSFDGKRFSIGGRVRSVEKNLWGEYIVKFEGFGAFNIFNLGNKVKEIELSFPKQHAKEMKTIRKGDGLIANCIGRGLSLGTYSADKCSVKGVYKKDQLRK